MLSLIFLLFVYVAIKLADDCCKYANDGPNSNSALSRASFYFGSSHNAMEKEREDLHRIFGVQVKLKTRVIISVHGDQTCNY